jgi:O-antigen ligase
MAKTPARTAPPAKKASKKGASSTASPRKGATTKGAATKGAQRNQTGPRSPTRQGQGPRAGRRPVAPLGPGPLAWAVTVGAVLLGVVALTNERTEYFGPRVTILLVLAALGLPTLALRAWSSTLAWPARAAVGFLVVAAVSAALSPAPLIGFFGADEVGTGWLFLLCLAALWALGTDLGDPGAVLLGRGLVLLALLNAGATVLEVGGQGWSLLGHVVAHFPGMQFGLAQPLGFASNPVYSAQLIVGGLALLAWRSAPRNPWAWWAMTAGLGVGTYLSGERYGLVLIAGLAVWVLATRKAKAAAAFAVATGGGLLVGLAFQKVVQAGSSANFRSVASANGAVGPRLRIWSAGLHAVFARPFFGIGPGQSQAATLPYRSVTSVVHDGIFPDTHNFLVEFAVTTGLLGLALFLAWLIPAVRRARGALLLYSLAILAGGLLEPLDLTTTSLAFLALGAAAVGSVQRDPTVVPGAHVEMPEWTTWATTAARVVAVVVALFAGITVMVGNTELQDGIVGLNPATLAAASRHLPMWSDGPNATSDVLSALGESNRNATLIQQAIAWNRVAIARNPGDATAWRRLGFNEAVIGNLAAASSALKRSLALDPTIQQTYFDEVSVAVQRGDTPAALRWAQRARDLFGGGQFDSLIRCLQRHDSRGVTPDQVSAACLTGSKSSSHT